MVLDIDTGGHDWKNFIVQVLDETHNPDGCASSRRPPP